MSSAYYKICETEFIDSYSGGEGNFDFKIVPTSGCREKLKDHKLYLMTGKGGFRIYCYADIEETDNALTVKPVTDIPGETFALVFLLIQDNPYLTNYARLSVDTFKKQVYYFHNLGTNIVNEKLLLSSAGGGEFISEKDRTLCLKSPQFTHSIHSSQAYVQIRIFNRKNVLISSEKRKVEEGVVYYPVNLYGNAEGRYRLTVDDTNELDFYLIYDRLAAPVLGMIELFFSKEVAPLYRLLDVDSSLLPKKYTLKIQNRSVYWKYYIVLKNRKEFKKENLKLIPSGSDLEFLQPEQITIPGGLTAILFESKNAVPLTAQVKTGIQLISTDSEQIFKVAHLPNPEISAVKLDKKEQNKYYTEIFYYI